MSGPSKRALIGHHLMEAIRHLSTAAEFVRELPDREDAGDLAMSVDRVMEAARDVRDDIERNIR